MEIDLKALNEKYVGKLFGSLRVKQIVDLPKNMDYGAIDWDNYTLGVASGDMKRHVILENIETNETLVHPYEDFRQAEGLE